MKGRGLGVFVYKKSFWFTLVYAVEAECFGSALLLVCAFVVYVCGSAFAVAGFAGWYEIV